MNGPAPGLIPTFGKCNQCGKYHPPVAGRCPMAAPEQPKNPDDISAIEIEKFLNNIRVNLQVKIKQLGIKDNNQLFLFLSTELNKLIDTYKE